MVLFIANERAKRSVSKVRSGEEQVVEFYRSISPKEVSKKGLLNGIQNFDVSWNLSYIPLRDICALS